MSLAVLPTKDEFEVLQNIVKYAVDSKHFDKLGGIPGAFTIALYAKEIGVPPITALMNFSNVQGKLTMSAELMSSLIAQAGHKVEILESTNDRCVIRGTRRDTKASYTATYTLEDARKAKNETKDNYQKYASDMLFARCISRLRRRLFADVGTKAYVHGEIEEAAEVKDESKIIDIAETSSPTPEALEHKPVVELPCMGMREDLKLMELVGDDIEQRNRCFAHYAKVYKREVKSFLDIPMEEFSTIKKKFEKHNEERLKKELETA